MPYDNDHTYDKPHAAIGLVLAALCVLGLVLIDLPPLARAIFGFWTIIWAAVGVSFHPYNAKRNTRPLVRVTFDRAAAL